MHSSIRRYITFIELSAKLGGRSRSSIYRDLENGRIPNPVRLGSRLYWVDEEVDQFLAQRRVEQS
ncbi:MAG: AlpA family phage regulatory protein [Pseudomonadota bacterium]